jgi:hypothetical protein
MIFGSISGDACTCITFQQDGLSGDACTCITFQQDGPG